jgi:hypothetical protein
VCRSMLLLGKVNRGRGATKQMRRRHRPTLRGWLDIAFTGHGFKGVENTLSHLSPAFTVTRMDSIENYHHLRFGSFYAAFFYRQQRSSAFVDGTGGGQFPLRERNVIAGP